MPEFKAVKREDGTFETVPKVDEESIVRARIAAQRRELRDFLAGNVAPAPEEIKPIPTPPAITAREYVFNAKDWNVLWRSDGTFVVTPSGA